jgi:hypothetical protein
VRGWGFGFRDLGEWRLGIGRGETRRGETGRLFEEDLFILLQLFYCSNFLLSNID